MEKEDKYKTPNKGATKPKEVNTGSTDGIDLEFDSDEEESLPEQTQQKSHAHNVPPLNLEAIRRSNATDGENDNGLVVLLVDEETGITYYTDAPLQHPTNLGFTGAATDHQP